ncbi:MAG: response regulator [Treponema sp.]|nr:response regulator [Treponema sp.]
MKTIFAVDDNHVNLLAAEEALSAHYNVFTLSSGSLMFELLNDVIPDLILLDILMPEISGFEALQRLKADKRYSGIPVMFLTSKNDAATEALGFEMGVVDFIPKPFSTPVLLNRIKTQLEIEDVIQERTSMLHHRTERLIRLQDSMTSVLANMVENRDKLTGKHIERTTKYIKILLNTMLDSSVYSNEINEWDFELVASSARLHDIGKVVITDLILNKPGSLTTDEYTEMKTHASEGEKIIDCIIAESGDGSFLNNAKLFAGSHHERWDGTGYPRKLKGVNIPLQGRIMAIADVYDALVSERSYKKAFPHDEAVRIIRESGGTHFDPELTKMFLMCKDEFVKVVQNEFV